MHCNILYNKYIHPMNYVILRNVYATFIIICLLSGYILLFKFHLIFINSNIELFIHSSE